MADQELFLTEMGKRISERRKKMGLTQEALAEKGDMTTQFVSYAEAGKRALTICAVTDSLVTGEALPPAERQSSLSQMMEIALETAVRMAKR